MRSFEGRNLERRESTRPEQAPTGRTFVTNAFSLGMLPALPEQVTSFPESHTVTVRRLHFLGAKTLVARGARSIVGHADTARVFSTELGEEIAFNRESVQLERGDVLIVGQYQGPRLPEGATQLPEGAQIVWLRVEVS